LYPKILEFIGRRLHIIAGWICYRCLRSRREDTNADVKKARDIRK